jgi:hypothetical protein
MTIVVAAAVGVDNRSNPTVDDYVDGVWASSRARE